MLCPDSSVDSVWHPEGLFISLDAKEGFICIVFQWLALAGEGSLLLAYPLQWLRITVEEAVRRQKD